MADKDFQEKTEQPTQKRLDDARQKGNVARSMEVNSVLVMAGGIGLLYVGGGFLYKRMTDIYYTVIQSGFSIELGNQNVYSYFIEGLFEVGVPLLLFMVGVMLCGLAANVIQVGFLLTAEPLIPKFDKLDPLNGFKKVLLSKRSMEELFKNILKLALIGAIGYFGFVAIEMQLPLLADQTVAQIASFMSTSALGIAAKIAGGMVVIAIADYAFQRYDHRNNLKMTKQEVKDEHKQSEGDPKVKSRLRSLQMQMTRNRMIQAVPEADVVITNPTHFAIAIKYAPGEMAAPKVLAKGKNLIAFKIREIAEEHEIPIVEDPPLAQALYKAVDVDQELPAEFFTALAEVLAYVYKMQGRKLN